MHCISQLHTFDEMSLLICSTCSCDYVGGKCYCNVKKRQEGDAPDCHKDWCKSRLFNPTSCDCIEPGRSFGHRITCKSMQFRPDDCNCKETTTTTTTKHQLSIDKEDETEQQQPDTKKIKLDPKYEIHDEWLEDSSLATLTVDVCLYVTDDEYNNKQQTHLLHLHCVPGVLAIHSPYFKAMIASDPKLTLIEMPESFTYHCAHKIGANGEIAINKQEVISLFKFFHAKGELEQITNRLSLMFMLFYINSPLFKKIEQTLDVSKHKDPLSYFNWAGYFKSDRLYSQLCKIVKTSSYEDNANNKKLVPLLVKSMPRDVLDRVMIDLCFL